MKLVLLATLAFGCSRSPTSATGDGQLPRSAEADEPRSRTAPATPAREAASPTNDGSRDTTEEPATPPAVVDTADYPWHGDATLQALPAVDHLEQRIAPPPGFARVPLPAESFGAWLRRLPLAAATEPVRSYRGDVLHDADHRNIAAVATLDVGTADLQQCADAVMRLHAEWSWHRGRRDVSYRAAAGTALPFERWARGERVVLRGSSLVWEPSGRPVDDHPGFRRYLNAVFSWANTVALAKQASPVELDDLRPGDFFILPGNPGHAVLVLDLAQAADGRRVVLLGQSYMPAQSFQVLQPSPRSAWFVVDPDAEGIQTPFWPTPFPWSSLRRLD